MAFIDVMACGLGAVILLFFIVDFQSGTSPSGDLEEEISDIKTEVEKLEQRAANLAESMSIKESGIQELADSVSDKALSGIMMENQNAEIADQNAALSAKLKEQLDKQGSEKDVPTPGIKGQLLGIPIEGKVVAILLDTSASMSYPKIADVIYAQVSSDKNLLATGQKWQQSKRLVNWVIDQTPSSSTVHLIAFSEKITPLAIGSPASPRAKAKLKASVNKLRPIDGTNLSLALEQVSKLEPKPTNVYIITDGLPNKAHPKARTLRGCRRSKNLVSGTCRESIFRDSLKRLSGTAKVDVFLLPMEGDPQAAPLFFAWVKSRQGRLMSVAKGWP